MPGIDFTKAEFTAAYGLAAQLPKGALPEIVFAGRSNVGKSSLINKLCGRRKLARVSATPGKTATINFYAAGGVFLVDLPGYGYAKTSRAERRRWDELINGYFKGGRDVRLLVQLLDCRHAPSKDDAAMLDYLEHYHIPFVAALTKADKLKPTQRARALPEFEARLAAYTQCRRVLLTSAETGDGILALREALQTETGLDGEDGV